MWDLTAKCGGAAWTVAARTRAGASSMAGGYPWEQGGGLREFFARGEGRRALPAPTVVGKVAGRYRRLRLCRRAPGVTGAYGCAGGRRALPAPTSLYCLFIPPSFRGLILGLT